MFDNNKLKKMIIDCLSKGSYRFTRHALEEQKNDNLDLLDVLRVLKTGVHEKDKTILTNKHVWKYAIRGKTEDLREVRVIIAFENEMIIITVIELKK
jgi:hypothetical protein